MLKNEKGNVMVFTVIAFAILFVFTMAVILIGDSSSKHAVKEESKTKAHYVAKTGAQSVIKHLEDTADSTGNMRDELIELLDRTNAGDRGEGKYKEGNFEIEVKEETRKGKKVYLVKSIGEIGKGDHIGKDQMTAVLTPEYQFDKSWGNGTIDAGDETVFLKGLHNLKGSGITINTEKKKTKTGTSPIQIQEGRNSSEDIMGLFDGNPNGDKVIHGYTLERHSQDSTNVYSETLKNDSLPDMEPISLNYGVVKNKPPLTFPTSYGSDVVRSNLTIDVNSPSIGQLVNEEYEIIDFDKNGDVIKETKSKQYLKISAGSFKLEGNNTIVTSKNTDVVIYTKVFFLNEFSKINIKGPGNVYIFASDQADLHQSSEIGVDLDDPGSLAANTNIHFYVKNGVKFGLEDNAKIRNTFLYGPGAGIGLDGGSVFTGRMAINTVDFNGETTIQSPVDGTPNEDHDPIIGFESIEWER